MKEFDNTFLGDDIKLLAGIDEAGRGPLAGPVCVACVVMPNESNIEGVNDSKKLSEKKREYLFDKIMSEALDVSVSLIDNNRIDEINILNATKQGMIDCIANLTIQPDLVLIDATKIESKIPTKSIIHGDAKSYQIACASIIAKVTRDRIMLEMDKKYPNYGFAKHKGYGTAAHILALQTFGPTEIHRKSFIKNFI